MKRGFQWKSLWGGVPAGILVSSKRKEYEKAKKHLAECKPAGGYIFGTSRSIMPGAKYENYANCYIICFGCVNT